jgi:hypothetical protein
MRFSTGSGGGGLDFGWAYLFQWWLPAGQPSSPIVSRARLPVSVAVLSEWQAWHKLCLLSSSSVPPLNNGVMWSTSVAMLTRPAAMQ